jgi:hypothetical protein
MKSSHYEVQVREGFAGKWDTAVAKDTIEEAEIICGALEGLYGEEHVRVRKVTTQEVYETVPGRTGMGRQRIKTSQGNVDVSVTNEHESVIRLPERGVEIYLGGGGIVIHHVVGANSKDPHSGITILDMPPLTR